MTGLKTLSSKCPFDPATVTPDAADDSWARDRVADVRRWQAFWQTLPHGGANLHLLDARSISNGAGTEQVTHGCFDNSVELVGQALGYILNPAKPTPVKVERLDY